MIAFCFVYCCFCPNQVTGSNIDFPLLLLFVEFDLEKEKSVLDEQGLRIAENQENSQKNRRKLAESTRGMSLKLVKVQE